MHAGWGVVAKHLIFYTVLGHIQQACFMQVHTGYMYTCMSCSQYTTVSSMQAHNIYMYIMYIYAYTFRHLSPAITRMATPLITPMHSDRSTAKSIAILVERGDCIHDLQLGAQEGESSLQQNPSRQLILVQCKGLAIGSSPEPEPAIMHIDCHVAGMLLNIPSFPSVPFSVEPQLLVCSCIHTENHLQKQLYYLATRICTTYIITVLQHILFHACINVYGYKYTRLNSVLRCHWLKEV